MILIIISMRKSLFMINRWWSMKPNARKFMTILIAGMLILAFAIPALGEENKAKVRVGFFESPYFQNIEEDGSFSGYSYDYLQAIAQYTGWEYEYVTTSNFSECQELLENGEIDIMGFLQKTPERQEIYDYPDVPSGISKSLLVTDKENYTLAYEDFVAFDGITVGLQKDFSRNSGFRDYCLKNNFAVHSITYDTKEELIDAIHTGKVDAILISSNQNSPDYRVIAQFDTSTVFYVTTKGNAKVLEGLNYSLKKIRMINPNFDEMLYKKYYDFTEEQPVVLSKEEFAYLKKHPTIRVLYDATWPPFEIMQENGIPHGIAIDILEAVSESAGVNFEYTYANNREEKKAMFSTGEYDVLSAITYSYQWANERKVFITHPYISIDYMAVSKKNRRENHHLALPKGFYISEVIEKMAEDDVTISYDDVTISYYDTVEDCIEAVNNDEADFTLANAYEAEYYMTIPKYRSLKLRTVEGLSQQLSVGVSKNADPLLFSIMTKGLASISQEELRDIIRDHINHPKKSDFFDMMYTNPAQFIIILVCMLVILGAYLTVSILYTIKNKQNELLQITNKAKSDFLSHVSHDMRTPMNAVVGMSTLGVGCTELEKSKEYHEKVNQASKYLLRLINDILDMSTIENNKLKLEYKKASPEKKEEIDKKEEILKEEILVDVAGGFKYPGIMASSIYPFCKKQFL